VTEDEWLKATKPVEMLKAARCRFRHRKLRLFAVACCRLVWHLLPDERSRRAVDVAERYVDDKAVDDDLRVAAGDAEAARREDYRARGKVRDCVSWAAVYVADHRAFHAAENVSWTAAAAVGEADYVTQAALVRDVLGNPFRPVTPLAPAVLTWNGGTVRRLAEAAYAERELPSGHLLPDRLAVLADALEEAGCTDGELLGHLRGPGPQVRGCWALDLLLAKE
jgi:hypothetical protein